MKMIEIGYFDCFSGIRGDMVLGALVYAGVDLREIEREQQVIAAAAFGFQKQNEKHK
jgi:uncharacterized protein (DUF111 family)